MADLQQQPTGHCCLQNVCWSLDTPCISGARENERIADGRLAVWREIQPGLSYCFAITKSIFYSLVPRLKVPWLVWCVIKRVSVQISAVALLSGGYGALVSSRHCLCQASLLGKGVVNSCTQLQIFCISTLENICNFNTNPSSRKEKQFLFFISLAFWKTDKHASNSDGFTVWQDRPATDSWQKFPRALLFQSLFPFAESFNTNIWLYFKKAKSSCSHHAPFQLACCKLAQSAPSRGPYTLTVPQCHTHGSYFVFIFLSQLHCAHLSKPTNLLEGQWPMSVLGDRFLKLSLGFIKALEFEAQLKALCQNSDVCLSFLCLGPRHLKLWVELPWKSEAGQQQRVD